MLLSNKIRIAGLILMTISLAWLWCCKVVIDDYLSLLNQEPVVRVSVISLWLPFGGMGAMICLFVMLPKSIFYGKKINELFSRKAMILANKVCLYFALIGVAFAIGWTYHSIDLLERYGYVYSRDLTKITPTGIHLKYIKGKQKS